MYALKRSSFWVTGVLYLIISVFFTASILTVLNPAPVYAAGEKYTWIRDDNIRAEGGEFAVAASLNLVEGPPLKGNYQGGVTLKNPGSGPATCDYTLKINVDDNDRSKATVEELLRKEQSGEDSCPTADAMRERLGAITIGVAGQDNIPPGCPGSPVPGPPSGPCLEVPPGGSTDEEAPICSTGESTIGGALAYIMCPITQMIVDATTFIEQNIIIPYLSVSPLKAEDGNAVYMLWQNIRNIANVAFIIAFFVVIFSQATSVGLSNYGIKRLLPRLAFVAIGANLSFFIVAFAIDAFNIFGAGIAQLVLAAIPQGDGGTGGPSGWQNLFALTAIGGGLALGAIVTTGKAVLGWLFSLIGIAFIIILAAVIVLVLRQMIILLLVAISPLAFVAYLLPNTEKYFTKWRDMLIQLLIMYPLIVLLFAVGKIVAALINSGDYQLASGESGSQTVTDSIKIGMGFFAAALPLIGLPALFALSGSIMSRGYRAIRDRGQKYGGAAAKAAGSKVAPYARGAAMGLAQNKIGEGLSRKNPKRWLGGLGRGVGYVGTGGIRKEEKEAARKRELERAQRSYLAGRLANKPGFRRSVAGVGGQAGAQRALAYAYGEEAKQEKEDIDNSMALLKRRLQDNRDSTGTTRPVDAKTFAGGNMAEYLRRGETAREVAKRGYSYQQIFSENPSLMQAAVNSAAEQGEINTVKEARMSGNVNQEMVDRVIRNNDSTLKGKGGYALATDFNLANTAGRDLAGKNAVEMQTEMAKADLGTTIAGSSAEDIASAKQGWLYEVATNINSIRPTAPTAPTGANATPQNMEKYRDEMDEYRIKLAKHNEKLQVNANIRNWLAANPDKRTAILGRLDQIAGTPSVRAKAPKEAINKIFAGLGSTNRIP